MYNYIGLEPRREAMHWQFGEMKFGEMKRNTSNWSNFNMLLRRAGLTASAGLSCIKKVSLKEAISRPFLARPCVLLVVISQILYLG